LEATRPSDSTEASPHAGSERPAAIEDHPDRIKVVSSPALERLLIAAPIAVGIVLAVGIFIGGYSLADPMLVSGFLAVIAALVIFQGFARRIPDAFERLRAREVVRAVDQAKFVEFQRSTTRLLNHPASIVAGVVFVVFALARFALTAEGIGGFLANLGTGYAPYVAEVVGEASLGFVLGLILWRMLIVAVQVRDLGDRFELRLQLNHPDKCGGFRPLGDLCLWNALLVSVPAIYLGFWIVLGPTLKDAAGHLLYGARYFELHAVFLGILAVLAPVTFIAPLWTIHLEMLRESTRLRVEVDQVGQQIDRLSRELLERSEEMSADEAAAKAHDLEIRQDSYKRTEHIPTWPIDVSLALRFGTSQVIPLLGLTGLSKPVVDAIGRFGSFITPS
jgi:hypothetical protein